MLITSNCFLPRVTHIPRYGEDSVYLTDRADKIFNISQKLSDLEQAEMQFFQICASFMSGWYTVPKYYV